MEGVQEKLDPLVRQGAVEADVEVYHWELRCVGRRAHLTVHVDRPGGVTLDDCARASRKIGALLDSADPVPWSYLLEVSSPGLERVLWEPRHYAQAIGKTVQVKLRPEGTHRGRLVGAAPESVTIESDGVCSEIPLARIAHARLVYEQERGQR